MSKNPENLDTSAERVYGIDTSQVEYDRDLIAKMLDELEPVVGLQHIRDSVAHQAALLRAAANRDAAGVHTGRASEAGDSELLNVIDLIRTGKDGRKYDYAISRADTMVHVAPLFAAAPAPGGG